MIAKKTSTRFSQDAYVGVKCRWTRGWLASLHLGVLVGGVVVQHDMQLTARVATGDQLEEVQELAVPVVGLAGVGHLPGGDLQRGEQGGRAVP
jgi:hypothetical protein